LTVGEALDSVLARHHEVLCRGDRIPGLLEVHRDYAGELALAARVGGEEGLGREPVERAPVLLQKGRIRGVLDEGVTEEILEVRLGHGHGHDQAARFKLVELGDRVHSVFASRSRPRIRTPNCRPITEATRSVRLLSGVSRSIRARSSPWSVSGISTVATRSVAVQRSPSRTMAPRSISIRMTSSTKNGFPSAFIKIRSRVAVGSDSMRSRLPTSVRLSSLESGSRRTSSSASPNMSRAPVMRRQPREDRSIREVSTQSTRESATSGAS